MNNPEPAATLACSARAKRELLVMRPSSVMENKLDSKYDVVTCTFPAALTVANLGANCLLLRIVNITWMMNVACNLGVVGVVDGNAPVELFEARLVTDEPTPGAELGVVNGPVPAGVEIVVDDEGAVRVSGVVGLTTDVAKDSEVTGDDVTEDIPDVSGSRMDVVEVLTKLKSDVDDGSRSVKDGVSEEDSEFCRLDVAVDKGSDPDGAEVSREDEVSEVLVLRNGVGDVELVSSTVEDDLGVSDDPVVDEASVEAELIMEEVPVEDSPVDTPMVEISVVDPSVENDSAVDDSVAEAAVVDDSVAAVVEVLDAPGVTAQAKMYGKPTVPSTKVVPPASSTMASGTNGLDPEPG